MPNDAVGDWRLRAPASGLSEDMVDVLEELEKLAVD